MLTPDLLQRLVIEIMVSGVGLRPRREADVPAWREQIRRVVAGFHERTGACWDVEEAVDELDRGAKEVDRLQDEARSANRPYKASARGRPGSPGLRE